MINAMINQCPAMLRIVLLLLPLLLLVPPYAMAQSATATLSGTVVDQNGAVVPGVTITLINNGTTLQRQATTNEQGGFTIPLLPPGAYTINTQRDGFSPVRVENVVLNVGDNKALQIQLKAGDVNAQVTIDSDAQTVRTDGSVGTVINRNQVANMPLNGRSLQALIQLTPGVVLTTNEGNSGTNATSGAQFSVNGQRTTSNYFTVDGVSANTGIAAGPVQTQPGQAGVGTGIGTTALGGTNSIASLDALQEFRVQTSTFAPEFGRTPGGQISLVTRAGSNMFNGNVSYYIRNEALDANNWFANAGGQPRPRERQNYVSSTLGGPIYLPRFGDGGPAIWSGRNRLFFFASYEGLRLEQPRAGQTTVPSLCLRGLASCLVGQSPSPVALRPFLNAIPLPNGQDFGNGSAQLNATWSDPGSFNIFGVRFDGRITNNLTAFFRYNHAPSQTIQRNAPALSSPRHTEATNNSYTGGITWVAGPKLTTDVRLNWTENQARVFNALDNFYGAVVPDPSVIFAPGFNPSKSFFTFRSPGPGIFSWGQGSSDTQRQFNGVGTVAYIKDSHQFKFGVDYRRLMPFFGETGGSFENIQFSSLSRIASGTPGLYQVASAIPIRREAIIPELSLFAQDTWSLSHRLTLTFGVRYEYLPSPSEATGQSPRVLLGLDADPPQNVRLAPSGTPLLNSMGSFAPRLGMAYQLGRRPGWETTVRGGVGQFYDLPFGEIATAFKFSWPFFVTKAFFGTVPFPPHQTPPVPGTDIPTSFSQLDPNIKFPFTIEWNGAWEQGIGQRQTITATYVGAKGCRLLGSETAFPVVASDWPTRSLFVFIGRNISGSRYDALQAQYNRRFNRDLQALASYTLGRSRDDLSSNLAAVTPVTTVGPLEHQWAPSDFDVRHVLSAAVSYDFRAFSKSGLLHAITSDWGSDLLFRYQSAAPLNPTVGGEFFLNGLQYTSIQANVIPGVPLYLSDVTAPGGRVLNNTRYTVADNARLAAAGCLWVARPAGDSTTPIGDARGALCTPASGQGNFPRNGLRGFAASQLDLAVRREFSIGDRVKLQLRAELFNLLNHPNFAGVTMDLSSGSFGKATQTLNAAVGGLNALYQMGGPRSGQLSVKLLF